MKCLFRSDCFSFLKIALFVLVSLSILAGCATPARIGGMTVIPMSAKPPPDSFFLKKAIVVKEVMGGESTNPIWTSEVGNPEFRQAIIESLRNHQLLAPNNKNGKYGLVISLEKIDQPLIGFDLTVNSTVHYNLERIGTNEKIFDEKIMTNYTATLSDSFYGPDRLMLANQGSIRENIRILIQKLLFLKN